MADTYSSSLLTNGQVQLATKYNEAELKRKERPVLGITTKNAEYTIPEWKALKTAEARTIEVKYLKATAAGSATAKVAAHTGTKGATGTMNLSYSCLTETFYTSAKMAQNNVLGFQTLFNHQLEQAIQNLLDRAETAGLAYAVAHNCQLTSITAKGGGTWSAANTALELSSEDYIVQQAKNFMRGRNYRGNFDMITDLNLYSVIERTMWQGAGNSVNLNPQMQGVNFAPTVETISSTYTGGAALIMPEGTFKALNWNDPLNVAGLNKPGSVGMFSTLLDPFGSGLIFDVSMYSARADESSNGGGVQDVNDQWEISLWLGWGLPPLSTANDASTHLIGYVG